MGKKKTILTEDLFNANGNANISNEIINESKESNNENEHFEEETIIENEELLDVQEEQKIDENEELENNEDNDEIEENNDTFNNEEFKEENDEIIKNIKSEVSPKKIGFTDESYYYDGIN